MSTLAQTLIEWMSHKGPREWHGVAAHWNWDEGIEPLLWILDQPTCDRATALTLFWAAEGYDQIDERHPRYAAGREDHTVARRVLENWPRYQTERFKFQVPWHARDLNLPSYNLSPETLEALKPLMVNIDGQERFPIYDAGVPMECRIALLEADHEPVTELHRRLLAEEQAGENLSLSDAEIAVRHQQELQESLSDLEEMIAEVERIRRQGGKGL